MHLICKTNRAVNLSILQVFHITLYLPVTTKVLKNTVKLANFGLESYSYDADGEDDLAALHLQVYAHEKIFGTKWKNTVTVSGEAGYLTIESRLFGFTANMAFNLNGAANATSTDTKTPVSAATTVAKWIVSKGTT